MVFVVEMRERDGFESVYEREEKERERYMEIEIVVVVIK